MVAEASTMAEVLLEHCQRTREDITSRPYTSHLSQWLESIDEMEAAIWDAIEGRGNDERQG